MSPSTSLATDRDVAGFHDTAARAPGAALRACGIARTRRRPRRGWLHAAGQRLLSGGVAGTLACTGAQAAPGGALATLVAPISSGFMPAPPAPRLPAMSLAPIVESAEAIEVLLLAVRVNGVDHDDTVRVVRSHGSVALNVADWTSLHLREPEGRLLRSDGQDYRPLDSLRGMRWSLDVPTQTLVIDAPSAAFSGMTLRMDTAAIVQTVGPSPGAYGNYDVEMQRTAKGANGPGSHAASALLEFGAFGGGGALHATGLLMDTGAGLSARRLDTTWTQDDPRRLASLRVGDAIVRPGAWGNALRIGGFQWATDFSLQPGLLTFPLPAVHGEATLPSSVDVYVNNSRRLQSDIPAGPFDLTELPIVTGSGEVRLVVHDALGREQVIVQPYYVSPSLLKPGLRSYSYEIGAARENYGLSDDHYGTLVASATDRVGVTDGFTRELRAEAQPRQAAVGATGIWLVPSLGLATLGLVASHAPGGNGALITMSLERQSANWNGSAQIRRSTVGFAQVGQGTAPAMRTEASVAVGGSLLGTPVGLSYVQQTPWAGSQQRLVSVNVSHNLGRFGSLGLFGLHDLASGASTVSLSLSVALGLRSSAALTATRSNAVGDRGSNTLQVQSNLPDDTGFGYQLTADRGVADRETAQVFGRTDWADLNAGASRTGDTLSTRAGILGGAAWLDDSVFVARHVDNSFAVIEVGDYADVRVLQDNRAVGRTDSSGRALVSGIRGNEVNHIGIEPADLPFDAAVDALDVEFVPPAHTGVVLRLPIRRSRSASFRVVGADGMPLPPGTRLRIAGRDTTLPVGFDGRTFASDIATGTTLRAHGPAGDCTLVIDVPGGDADDLPDLGTVSCR